VRGAVAAGDRTPAEGWRIGALCGRGSALSRPPSSGSLTPTSPQDLLAPRISAAIMSLGMPLAELIALCQWRLALELDQACQDAAELGATRERLRFAEDLHDILGHALEVVSLKSELAARLGQVDPARAHAEMVEVQRLARGALRTSASWGRAAARPIWRSSWPAPRDCPPPPASSSTAR
jgi:glucose-6-phosphate-specific signal transduction histidine kinase